MTLENWERATDLAGLLKAAYAICDIARTNEDAHEGLCATLSQAKRLANAIADDEESKSMQSVRIFCDVSS